MSDQVAVRQAIINALTVSIGFSELLRSERLVVSDRGEQFLADVLWGLHEAVQHLVPPDDASPSAEMDYSTPHGIRKPDKGGQRKSKRQRRIRSRSGASETVSVPARRSTSAITSLTEREFQVAVLVALGKTNAQIATKLCLSPHTIHHYLESVMSKLGVHRRSAVASLVTNEGGPDSGNVPQLGSAHLPN